MAKLAAALIGVASGDLAITWTDCGDASTHGKIADVEPKTLSLGAKTTVTGSGTVDEPVTGGTFKASLTAGGGIIKTNWSGDLCSPSTKMLPMGLGEIDFQGMSCPVAAGAQSLSMGVKLSGSVPASLATSDVQLDASSSSGDKLICMKLHMQKASFEEEAAMPAAAVAITWSDCGDASTHGKIADVEPKTLSLGAKTTVTGSGTVDEQVTGGTFKASLTAGGGIIKTNWSGDLCSPSTKMLPMGLGEIDFQGMSCPVAAGAQSLSMGVKLSGSIPASLVTSDVQLDASTTSGDKLICMKLHMQKASVADEVVYLSNVVV